LSRAPEGAVRNIVGGVIAARLVLDDTPLKGTGGPVPEYKAAMKAVAEHPLYQEKAKKEKSFDESIFQEAIEGLFADHAESEYQSKLGKPVSAAH